MDYESTGNASDKLRQLQSNISSLFEDLRNERDQYKFEKERLADCLKAQLSGMVSLKNEIEILQNSPKDGPSFLCKNCMELKERLVHQDKRLMELEKHLAEFLKMNYNSKACPTPNKQKREDSSSFEGVKSPNVTQDALWILANEESLNNKIYNVKAHESNIQGALNRSSNNDILNIKYVHDEESQRNDEPCYLDTEQTNDDKSTTMVAGLSKEINKEFLTPKKVDKMDTGNITSNHISPLNEGGSPILLREQRYCLDRFPVTSSPQSPLKRNIIAQSTSSPSKMYLKSPKQRHFMSPVKCSKLKSPSHLRLANAVEAEFSSAGVRKLKQAQLNIQYYKSKHPESSGNDSDSVNTVDDKIIEDDVIMPSPKASLKSSEYNFRNESKRSVNLEKSEETTSFKQPRVLPDIDLDETYVSASFLESRRIKQTVFEPEAEENVSPVTGKRSPEYDSVHFHPPCKTSPVRKRVKRMQLPGQMCPSCYKYYSAILDEIDPRKLQEIINRCSRHRERECDLVNTPPGYWKPYLTDTVDPIALND